ncbi:hypothetical protein M900_A0313 [Bacteriovorax sp. Seq25_V]|nr:hypothetical protein M900_A0313 [Bacteriovorax sp. Seq25_V]
MTISLNITAKDFSFSLGTLNLGEKRLSLNLDKVKVVKEKSNPDVSIRVVNNSTEWAREAGNILSPKALVSISVRSPKVVSLKYESQVLLSQGEGVKNTVVYIDLYSPKPIEIFEDERLIEIVNFEFNAKSQNNEGVVIDYSCAPYGLEVEGIENEYATLGCVRERLGKIGSERNRIIVTAKVNKLRSPLNTSAPYFAILMNERPVITTLQNPNEKLQVKLKAKFPKRANRVHLALGLGPYTFNTHDGDKAEKEEAAPALMIYSKLDISDVSSFRFFEALVYKKSLFSNTGLYFAYELATAFDNKVQIVPLLGAQILTYKFDSRSSTTNKIIYPQGFEASFNHALGIKNFNFTYGMFLSTQTNETYKNLWLRWGKKYFWEINYIKWARERKNAEMLGISIGIPIGKLF